MHALLARCWLLILPLVALSGQLVAAQPEGAGVDADQVNQAIDRGVAYLKRVQTPRGTWFDLPAQSNGVTALCALALLNAGVDPEDIALEKALNELRKEQRVKTYATALSTMVFCAADPKKESLAIVQLIHEIRETEVTILVIEHVMKAIMSLSDRVAVLHHGELIAIDTPSSIANDERVVEAYLGEEFQVVED